MLQTQIDAFNQVLKQITSHNPQQEGSGILDPKVASDTSHSVIGVGIDQYCNC